MSSLICKNLKSFPYVWWSSVAFLEPWEPMFAKDSQNSGTLEVNFCFRAEHGTDSKFGTGPGVSGQLHLAALLLQLITNLQQYWMCFSSQWRSMSCHRAVEEYGRSMACHRDLSLLAIGTCPLSLLTCQSEKWQGKWEYWDISLHAESPWEVSGPREHDYRWKCA